MFLLLSILVITSNFQYVLSLFRLLKSSLFSLLPHSPIFSQHAGLTTSILKNLIIYLYSPGMRTFFWIYWRLFNWTAYFLAVLLFLNIMSYLLTFIHFPSTSTFSISFLQQVRMKNRSMDSGTHPEKLKGEVNKWGMSSAAISKSNILEISFLWICFKLKYYFLKYLVLQ